MTSSEIVSAIEMQFNDKYHEKGFVFKKSSRGDSFYLVAKRGNKKPIQIRLSDHGTYVKTWTDLANKKDSTIRLVDPSFSINYSIVFIDNGNNLTSDCIGQPNCENCKIPECIPQELKGVTDKKHTYQVMQYVYDSSVIKMKYIQGFVNVIYQTIRCGKFIDPLSNAVKKQNDNISIARKARQKQLRSIFIKESQLCNMILESVKRVINIEHSILLTTESKNNKNMKKNVQRINESQLRAIVAESVKKVLKESHSMEIEAALQDICRASSLIRNKTEYTQEEDYEPDYEIGYNDAAYLHKWASEIEEQAGEWLRN